MENLKKSIIVISSGNNEEEMKLDRRLLNHNVEFILTDHEENLSKKSSDFFDEGYVFTVFPSDNLLESLLRVLKSKGKLLFEKQIPSREVGQNLCSDLTIAGFVDTMAAKDPSTGERFVVCQKPSWSLNEVASIPTTTTATTESSKWKMNMNDLAENDLVDENELLDDGLSVPINSGGCGDVSSSSSSSSGKKRACKNCTCGFEEELQAAESSNSQQLPVKSACGNCYRGDAFRCASCPFLGQPVFDPNSNKVLLTGTDDL